jgi:hypothetical protein
VSQFFRTMMIPAAITPSTLPQKPPLQHHSTMIALPCTSPMILLLGLVQFVEFMEI